MKMKYAVAVLLFLGSCREADLPTPESENIIGDWEWIESRGGNVGDRITPESTGNESLLEIKDNSRFKRFENGKKESSGKWSIKVSDVDYADYIIDFGDETNGSYWVSFLGKDTLSLYLEKCRDCRTSIYARK